MGRGYLKLKVSWNTPVLHMLWTRPLDALRVHITLVQEAIASTVGNQVLLHLIRKERVRWLTTALSLLLLK